MKLERVVLIGGTGFLGSALANRLSAAGISTLIPTRRRARAAHLLTLPTVEVVQADIHDRETLTALLQGAQAVVNLVGVLHSREGQPWGEDFDRAHVALPDRIVTAAEAAGVARLLHLSALGANDKAPSAYLRSKATGETKVRAFGGHWTILRPSVVFGPQDSFLRLFATLLALFPVMPLGGAQARFQPVFVEDVAEVALRCLDSQASTAAGQCYELAGPTVYTLAELVRYVGELTGHPRPVIALPDVLATLQASLLGLLPKPPMSRDNLRSMQVDNVASGPALPFGLIPTALEAVAPCYLGQDSLRARYPLLRTAARRKDARA